LSDLNIYDVEATDVDVRHGQITQFASLRADENFQVLEETDLRIRRLPYVVPAPEALRVTGINPFDLDGTNLPTEFEAARLIERALRPRYGKLQINTTYNGLRYDDEIIRTTLFRNLLSPWFSSGKNISRVDLLSVIRMVHAGDPEAIAIPTAEDGSLSWKLEAVCLANGIAIRAHDAMGDVRATMELARLVRERAAWAWDQAVQCGQAASGEAYLAARHASGEPAWLFTHYGKPDLVPCAVLGTDSRKKWILADLRSDGLHRSRDEISSGLYTKDSPFRVIRSNASPLLLAPGNVSRLAAGANIESFNLLSSDIREEGGLRERATRALMDARYESPPSPTSEERIYDGFIPDAERPRMQAFLNAGTWAERASVRFADPRLRDFAARIVVEAIGTGRAVDVPQGIADEAAIACAEAYERPYAASGARWMTLSGAREKGADAQWEAWASDAFQSVTIDRVAGPHRGEELTAQAGFGF